MILHITFLLSFFFFFFHFTFLYPLFSKHFFSFLFLKVLLFHRGERHQSHRSAVCVFICRGLGCGSWIWSHRKDFICYFWECQVRQICTYLCLCRCHCHPLEREKWIVKLRENNRHSEQQHRYCRRKAVDAGSHQIGLILFVLSERQHGWVWSKI